MKRNKQKNMFVILFQCLDNQNVSKGTQTCENSEKQPDLRIAKKTHFLTLKRMVMTMTVTPTKKKIF